MLIGSARKKDSVLIVSDLNNN